VEFYGAEHVMYGSDYPCWDPDVALGILDELELDDATYRRITRTNAEEFYRLGDTVVMSKAG
jgi:aminocarboxymuconate-semialdehyde decarboxylase